MKAFSIFSSFLLTLHWRNNLLSPRCNYVGTLINGGTDINFSSISSKWLNAGASQNVGYPLLYKNKEQRNKYQDIGKWGTYLIVCS